MRYVLKTKSNKELLVTNIILTNDCMYAKCVNYLNPYIYGMEILKMKNMVDYEIDIYSFIDDISDFLKKDKLISINKLENLEDYVETFYEMMVDNYGLYFNKFNK
jgi:hypothetical protein